MPSINAIADALTPDAQRKLLAALRKMSANVSIPALTSALQKGDVGQAMQAIKVVQFPSHLKPLAHTINTVFQQAATETMKPFVKVDPTFAMKNPLAIAAADWSGQKITQISDDTRQAVRTLIRKGLTEGIEPKRLAKEIKPLIGLNARQAIAVQNASAAWAKAGLDAETVAKKAGIYTEKLRKQRALMIARTETIGSSNRGQLHSWRAAAKAGLLDPSLTSRRWMATRIGACPYCRKMDKQEIAFHESFVSSINSAAVQHPPLHPNCRCTTVLIVAKSDQKLPPTFSGPPPVPEAAPPPLPVLPSTALPSPADVLAQEQAQNAALDAALAAKKAKALASKHASAARWRAKKKAEREAAKLAAKVPKTEDRFEWSEFEQADKALNVEHGYDVVSGAKRDIMVNLSDRLKDSAAEVSDVAFGRKALRSLSVDQRNQWVSQRVSIWAGTSGDSDQDAIAMQLAVRDVFGIADADMSHFPRDVLTRAESLYTRNGQAYREFVRVMHNNTQEWFQAQGMTHVTLVRGANYGAKAPTDGWGEITLQPASSFSTDISISAGFGKTMHVVRVPIRDVLGSARTGYGCLNEHEFVVLGGRKRAWSKTTESGYASSFNTIIADAIKKGTPE